MLQKEVVERIASSPGNKHYGRLSVMLQTFCTVQSLFEVPPYAFEPAPKVDSAILRLLPRQDDARIANFTEYEKLVRQAFSQRRKTLKNTLKNICSVEQIEEANLKPGQRAEELSTTDFINLYNVLD
jgi:16S rRNA (adenine1518-N6/adenine1519-N6)-dimethyltransferase